MEFWQPPPQHLALQPDQVHVWRANLQTTVPIEQVLPLLSPDEQARASRFYFEKDRNRFVWARSILRLILSRYLNLAAQDLQFQYGSTGKPYLSAQNSSAQNLPGQSAAQPLCFNLSHSQQWVLYAVAQNREVGVDVEQIRPERDWQGIAARFFSAPEQQALAQLDAPLKLQGFFNCWTRKEALLKAIGKGLTLPLDQFVVSLTPGQPAQLLQTFWDAQEAARWSMADLPMGEDYAAAVAGVGSWDLQGWQFDWNQVFD